MSIIEAIEKIEELGDDEYKKNVIFGCYIEKIKERILNNKSSININSDIDITRG